MSSAESSPAASESRNPPWFVYDPTTGRVKLIEVPEQLRTHPEVQRRGLELTDPLKPGFVYVTSFIKHPQYAVKILTLETEEKAIYERLLQDLDDPTSHTLPCEVTTDGHPLLIMPCARGHFSLPRWEITLHRTLSLFLQLVEGVEYLHRQNIAHLDLCDGNVVGARLEDAENHACLVSRKLYIIDFDTSMQLDAGPGEQPALTLPPTQVRPPNNLKYFDPYSWDVYCLGNMMNNMLEVDYFGRPPAIARRYAEWLMGEERGCENVCRCRPTARRARQVLAVVRLAVYVSELYIRSVVPDKAQSAAV
ncbi:hypothetical protein BD413DRAFT_696126 [Trametes elegans]|nr:hypothetical protein BD413DRAFT_696126 [Trametes elegans]